jgi:hypothetical protein
MSQKKLRGPWQIYVFGQPSDKIPLAEDAEDAVDQYREDRTGITMPEVQVTARFIGRPPDVQLSLFARSDAQLSPFSPQTEKVAQ